MTLPDRGWKLSSQLKLMIFRVHVNFPDTSYKGGFVWLYMAIYVFATWSDMNEIDRNNKQTCQTMVAVD